MTPLLEPVRSLNCKVIQPFFILAVSKTKTLSDTPNANINLFFATSTVICKVFYFPKSPSISHLFVITLYRSLFFSIPPTAYIYYPILHAANQVLVLIVFRRGIISPVYRSIFMQHLFSSYFLASRDGQQ